MELPPAILNPEQCRPHYPGAARALKLRGNVDLNLLIDANGTLLMSTINNTSGSRLLDHTALEAVGQCKFKPGTRYGLPHKDFLSVYYKLAPD